MGVFTAISKVKENRRGGVKRITAFLLISLALLLMCAVGVSAAYIEEVIENPKITIPHASVVWKPDGVFSEGEYAKIELNPDWISIAAASNKAAASAIQSPISLYMSYDAYFVYVAATTAADQFVCDIDESNVGNMWAAHSVMLSFANIDAIYGFERAEYGYCLSSIDNCRYACTWVDPMGLAYDPDDAGDYIVVKQGNTLIYEMRVPFAVFEEKALKEGDKFLGSVVWAVGTSKDGGSDAYIHQQLGHGVSGDPGKDPTGHAIITLGKEVLDHTHTLRYVESVPFGSNKKYPEHFICDACRKTFSDSDAKTEIEVTLVPMWDNPFTDINRDSADYPAVEFVCKNGLFKGTSDTSFSPDVTMTRGMFVTVLGRMEGVSDTPVTGSAFPDVDVSSWYAPYVGWAVENNIVLGYDNGNFGPNDKINIEQACIILSRYAAYLGGTLNSDAMIPNTYTDRNAISSWASKEVAWMVDLGIYEGSDHQLMPKAEAKRVVVAKMLYKFSKNSYKLYHINGSEVSDSVGLAYAINEDGKTCTITGIGTCKDTMIGIPETIDGYTVTCIGDRAFSQRENITFIKIPETVEKIGRRAFYGCTGLSEITIPESVSDIGEQVFYKASNLHTVYYNSTYGSAENLIFDSTNVKTVVFGGNIVPDHILDDGSDWIMGTINYDSIIVQDIVILDSVTSIGKSAFAGCQKLTSITIPDSVTCIGEGAFTYCSDLTSITIPDSVTSIDNFTFFLSGLQSITIPDSVLRIGNNAFHFCSDLTSITIPDSVTSIGDYAFIASGLTDITIPDSVTSIGYMAFTNCDGLTSIIIPDSLKIISDEAFEDCDNLTSVTIPDSVKSIGLNAFSNCINLTSIYFNNTKARWNSINKGGWDDVWERYADWDENTDNYTIYCTDGIITK